MLGAGDDGAVLRGGKGVLEGVRMEGAFGSGLKLTAAALVEGRGLQVHATKRAAEIAEGSALLLEESSLSAEKEVLMVDDATVRHGPSRVELNRLRVDDGAAMLPGTGNKVTRDGIPMEETARQP